MRRQTARIGWVVDVQNDFAKRVLPGGRLYVHDLFDPSDPGAEAVEPNIVRAVTLLEGLADVLVFTGDWHAADDAEIDPVNPDPQHGTYPPHCMGFSPDPAEREGAQIIPAIRPQDPLVLERDATLDQAREIAVQAVRTHRAVFIQKGAFSVFEGNPATDAFLQALQAALGAESLEFFVLGHAREVCVAHFLEGRLAPERRGRGYRAVALTDCMAGLGLEREADVLARWRRLGAETTTLSVLERCRARAA